MAELPQIEIDAPIAGQSLTAELGNRPWQQPPQYATVEEALEYYIPRITEPTLQDDLMNVIELGIPLTTIADALQSGGAMEGKHTIDVGILIMPVLMETLAYLAEEQGIEYEMGTDIETDDTPSSSAVALAIKKVKAKSNQPVEEELEEQMEMELEEPSGGLMSRRTV
jgi:hypothetical protein